jgi:hypothetical protein
MVDQHGTHVAQAQPAKLLENDSKVSAQQKSFFTHTVSAKRYGFPS